MITSPPPAEPAAQLQWLVDRAAISDLLVEFARALDEQDWDAYADTYAEDGELAISPTIAHRGRSGLADFVSASLSRYPGGTHHLSTNHAIALEGDEATTRSYLCLRTGRGGAHRRQRPAPFEGRRRRPLRRSRRRRMGRP